MRRSPVLGSVVIGPHSSLSNWVFDVVRRLAEADGSREVRTIDRHDHIAGMELPRPIYLTHYPSASIVDAIERGHLSVLLVIEDPGDATGWLQRALRLPLIEAIRSQTATAIANRAIGHAAHVMLLDRASERNALDIAQRVARFLELEWSETVLPELDVRDPDGRPLLPRLEQVLEARGDSYAPPARLRAESPREDLATLTAALVDPLIAMARGDVRRPVVWPSEVFKFADRPDEAPPAVAEVGGPARVLYYGPYLYLPPGKYRVEAVIAFSEEIRNAPFVLEVHGAQWLAKARIEQRQSGEWRGFFVLTHTDPIPTLEIRLRLEQGVERGKLSLIELRFYVLDENDAV